MIFEHTRHLPQIKYLTHCWKHRRAIYLIMALFIWSINFHFRIAGFLNNRHSTTDLILTSFANASGLLRYQYKEHSEEIYPIDTPLCPTIPPKLIGECTPKVDQVSPPTWAEIRLENWQVIDGGSYSPRDCKARHRTAIIIPLRNRESQARIFLSHMHPIWQRQQIDYKVYLITQQGNGLFNRAKLLNIGFAEASKGLPLPLPPFLSHDFFHI